MKTFPIILTAIFGLLLNSNATVITVSNSTNSPGQYSDITSAIAAASAGDTIYVHGTNFNYGDITLDKQLTLIGSGHRPQNQNANASIIDQVTFSTGSSGSRIIGFIAERFTSATTGISNIYIARNAISNQVHSSGQANSDWVIDGNVFTGSGNNINQSSITSNTNWRMLNNIFNGYMQSMAAQYSYYYNNLFFYNGDAIGSSVASCYFYNNIFYRASPNSPSPANIFANNLSYQSSNNAFINGVNIEGQDPMFEDFPAGGADFDYTHDYHIQSGSPAENAGTDGSNLGVYGGNEGYFDLNGIPNIPQIREFTITSGPTVAPGSTIDINVKSTIKP